MLKTALFCVALSGCATTLATPPLPSLLPASIDVNDILGLPSAPIECNSKAPRFNDLALNEDHHVIEAGIQLDLQAGFLIDECTYVKNVIEGVSTLRRVTTERNILKGLRTDEHAKVREGEKAYQDRNAALEKKAERSWWEENRFFFGATLGVVFGVTATAVAFVAAMRLTDANAP